MSGSLFWLSDEAWAAIEPHLPKNQPSARRVDDRRVILGIIHMLKCGGRWQDVPAVYGPATTVYNRWNRWSRRGVFRQPAGSTCGTEPDRRDRLPGQHLREGAPARRMGLKGASAQAIGVPRGGRTTKIHAICDLLGRPVALRLTPGNTSDIKAADELIEDATRFKRLVADRGYDANHFRTTLREAGTTPVIPGRINRKRPIRRPAPIPGSLAHRCRVLPAQGPIATRYDKLATNFLSAVALAAAVAFWL